MFILAAETASSLPPVFRETLDWIVLIVYAITVAVLVWGVMFGVMRFIATEMKRIVGAECDRERARLRKQVGFYLLFAMELLIAADVIETMLNPTLEHLGILGGISLIRIAVGYALGRELGDVEQEVNHV